MPDFVANAGGVIHIHALRAALTVEQLRDAVLRIGTRVYELLAEAQANDRLPVDVAVARAHRVLATGGPHNPMASQSVA